MGWYQAFIGDESIPAKVYHMCPLDDFQKRPPPTTEYFSKDFEKDGQVIRTTHDVSQLTEIANCFYSAKSPPEQEWICLEISTMGLRMNGIECRMVKSELDETQQCPHIYGGVPVECVTKTYPVQRDAKSGAFVAVVGLKDTCGCSIKTKNKQGA